MDDVHDLIGRPAGAGRPDRGTADGAVRRLEIASRRVQRQDLILGVLTEAYERDRRGRAGPHELG